MFIELLNTATSYAVNKIIIGITVTAVISGTV